MFNADLKRELMLRPKVIIDGKTYEGKLLSWEEYAPWAKKLTGWMHNQVSDEDAKKDIMDFLRVLDLPAERIVQLEQPVLEDIMIYLFNCLRRYKVAPSEGTKSD